jgi:hypothetical protein
MDFSNESLLKIKRYSESELSQDGMSGNEGKVKSRVCKDSSGRNSFSNTRSRNDDISTFTIDVY